MTISRKKGGRAAGAGKSHTTALVPARSERGDLMVSTLVRELGAMIEEARR